MDIDKKISIIKVDKEFINEKTIVQKCLTYSEVVRSTHAHRKKARENFFFLWLIEDKFSLRRFYQDGEASCF